MKSNPLVSLRVKIAVIGVLALGAFTGAVYAAALPGSVQRGVSGMASNLGLSVPSGESPSIAPLEVTTTTPGTATTTPAGPNVDNGAQNDGANSNVENGAQNDAANGNVDKGAENDGAHDNVDSGTQNDGAQGNADQGQQGNADQGSQGEGNQGNGNH
jgi:hypothetical protein